MKAGGWLRLEFDMNDEQMEAVTRLGLDPFDLTQETHRMHALQLADPMAKDVHCHAKVVMPGSIQWQSKYCCLFERNTILHL